MCGSMVNTNNLKLYWKSNNNWNNIVTIEISYHNSRSTGGGGDSILQNVPVTFSKISSGRMSEGRKDKMLISNSDSKKRQITLVRKPCH